MNFTYGIQRNTDSSSNIRSVFYCVYAPDMTWDLNNTTPWRVLVCILYIASPVTALLNALVIVAVKKKKELRRNSNILLTSMAGANLVMGVINMPLRATVDVLVLRQLWIQQICLLDFLNIHMTYCIAFSCLYHLTVIAWERQVAIVKWMDYKVIVTRNRVRNLAIIAWLASVFTVLPVTMTSMFGASIQIVETLYIVWTACGTVSLLVITYFYVKVYLGVRKRRLSEINQVSVLVKAKLESKVAKTTVLLTTTIIFSAFPTIVFYILSKIFPIINSFLDFRFLEAPIMLYSTANPLLYCYRDCRFRKAVLELVRIRKSRATVGVDGAMRHVRRKHPIDEAEDVLRLQNVGKSATCLLTRAATCDLAPVPGCVHGKARKITLKRSLSDPTIDKYNIHFDGLQRLPHSTVLTPTVTIHKNINLRNNDIKSN